MSLDQHTGFHEELMLSISVSLFNDEPPFSAPSGMEVFVHDPLEAFIWVSPFRPFPEH
jgi:hypothetical protein